jgi:transcriptional regulator with XRE-family HTH domain
MMLDSKTAGRTKLKLGYVLRKEREGVTGLNRHRAYSLTEMADALGITADEYAAIERDDSPAEKWFTLLCRIAIKLEIATSRLLARNGGAERSGPLIRFWREERGFTVEEMSDEMGLSLAEYVAIERGESPIEHYGPLLRRFSELIDQPLINLYLPCGVPFDQLHDYP